MNGSKVSGGEGNGISTGTLWLSMADVDVGGSEIDFPVNPTVRRTTTFWIDRGFWVQSLSTGRLHSRWDEDAYFDSHPTGRGRISNKV
jgi:hypothetical protein